VDGGSKSAVQWQLTKYVRNLMAGMFQEQIMNNNPSYPTDQGQLEVVTGVVLDEDGILITTDQSSYLVTVKKVGED
jgi:hypothetical protein